MDLEYRSICGFKMKRFAVGGFAYDHRLLMRKIDLHLNLFTDLETQIGMSHSENPLEWPKPGQPSPNSAQKLMMEACRFIDPGQMSTGLNPHGSDRSMICHYAKVAELPAEGVSPGIVELRSNIKFIANRGRGYPQIAAEFWRSIANASDHNSRY
jgi:hypothetical protein